MFKGEKTLIFCLGLIILGIAIIALFWILWYLFVMYPSYIWTTSSAYKNFVPMIFGSVVFLLIGFYMMTLGVKKEEAVKS